MWSDESKFNLFGFDGIRYVRKPPKQRFSPRYQLLTVKHGEGSIMVKGKERYFHIRKSKLCIFFVGTFTRDGVGPLTKIEGKM